jgi:hypothetical protein
MVPPMLTTQTASRKEIKPNDRAVFLDPVSNAFFTATGEVLQAFTGGAPADTTSPVVSTVSAPANGTYNEAQNLNFTLNFSEAVNVSGTPRLTLTIGSSTAYANYVSGSGTTALLFRYTVFSGDNDDNGISLGATIGLNGGSIKDPANNNAVLSFTPPNLTGVLVSTFPPNGASTAAARNAALFDGSTAKYTFAKTSFWDFPAGDWFLAVWMRIGEDKTSETRHILQSAASGGGMLQLYLSQNRPFVVMQPGTYRQLNSGTYLDTDTWRLLVLQRVGTDYFLKTIAESASTVTTAFTLAAGVVDPATTITGTDIKLGVAADGTTGPFKNDIAWVAKGTGTLTESQMVQLAGGAAISSLSGITLQMNVALDGVGNASDLTGNGNTATKAGTLYVRGTTPITGQPVSIGSAIVAGGGGSPVTVNNFGLRRGFVFQRSAGQTSKSITFTGPYTGSPSGIEARIVTGDAGATVVVPWTAATTPSAGVWNCTLSVPQGGNYTLEVRHTGQPATTARTDEHFAVGAVFVYAGQSNAENQFTNSTAGAYAVSQAYSFRTAARMKTGTLYRDMRVASQTIMAGIHPMLDKVSAALNIPVMAVDASTGGSGLIGGWDNPSSGFYTQFTSILADIGGDCEGILWFQGEADAVGSYTAAQYATSLQNFAANARTAVGRSAATLPFFSAVLGRKGSVSATDSWGNIRKGTVLALNALTNAHHLGGYYDQALNDDLHYTGAAYRIFGHRVTRAILAVLQPGSYPTGVRGPNPTGASFSGQDITVTYALNGSTTLRGLTGATGLTGFVVKNSSGTAQTISATAIPTANTVVLTISGGTPATGWTVDYVAAAQVDTTNLLYGDLPVADIAGNGTVPALPLASPITL